MPMNDKYDAVLHGLNEYLRVKLSQLSSESSGPVGNASTVRQLKEEIKRLRVVREDFENIIAGLSYGYTIELCAGK